MIIEIYAYSSSQIRSNEVGVIEKKKSMTDNHPDNQKLEKKNGKEMIRHQLITNEDVPTYYFYYYS